MPGQRLAQRFSCGCIPQADGAVAAGRGQARPVRAEGQAVDPVGVAGQRRVDGLAGGHVPAADRAVAPGAGQREAVRGEGHTPHPVGVAVQVGDQLRLGLQAG